MNIDGTNTLACTKAISECGKAEVPIYPLPHMPVVKDLVPDLTHFYAQYASIKPWIRTQSSPPPDRERLQSKEDRAKLDGLYECILCACCRSEEHTSELQSLMRNSYAVFCLKKKHKIDTQK